MNVPCDCVYESNGPHDIRVITPCSFHAIVFAQIRREPVPMILTCPECAARHIDEGDFAKRLHHTHACQKCGMVWRPAIVNTFGVQFLPGFKNYE